MKRGEIYLANFAKKYNSEFGKVRPALIIQNNIANRNIEAVDFKGITVIPLTTKLFDADVRVRIIKRDKLNETSDICVNELCTLDMTRLELSQCLTSLSQVELDEVERKLREHLSL